MVKKSRQGVKQVIVLINILLVSLVGVTAPADDFVITVQTDAPDTTDPMNFIISTLSGGYNYNVDCNNDGLDEASAQTGDYICDYSGMGGAGTYTIRIKDNSGTGTGFPHFYSPFASETNSRKIMSLDQWGTGRWRSMLAAFRGARNMLVLATDVPDLTLVTVLQSMFSYAESADPDVSAWDVSSVIHMSGMFEHAYLADPDVSAWDVSSVTVMSNMFRLAFIANPDVSDWDVSSVTHMSNMFYETNLANPDVSAWDVSSVTVMRRMFYLARLATPDVSAWDVSSVTDMSDMFHATYVADPDVSGWDVSSVTDMSGMFRYAGSAYPDVSTWDVVSVTDMSDMFSNTSSVDPDVSAWNVSSVIDMSRMFLNAHSAEPDLSNWHVTALLDASDMFQNVTLPTSTYDALLNNWGGQVLQNNVPFSAGNSRYCNGETARSMIISSYGWTITDGGYVECTVDISITKTLETAAPYHAFDNIQYTLVVSNNGPGVATDVLFTDNPTNLTIESVNSKNCSAMPCTIATMASGATETITLVATINANGAFDNSASAHAVDVDTNLANNIDNTNNGGVTASADIAITKTLDTAAPYHVGDGIQYTLVVSNNGPETATDLLISDIPTNLTVVSVSSPNCKTMPCAIASMANGATETITMITTINANGAFDNSAIALASEEDPDMDNNTDGTGNGGTAIVLAPVTIITLSSYMLLILLLLVIILARNYGFKKIKHQ